MAQNPMVGKKHYIGDGVYGNYDGYRIILTTEDGTGIQNTIYFEPDTLKVFEDYVRWIREADASLAAGEIVPETPKG